MEIRKTGFINIPDKASSIKAPAANSAVKKPGESLISETGGINENDDRLVTQGTVPGISSGDMEAKKISRLKNNAKQAAQTGGRVVSTLIGSALGPMLNSVMNTLADSFIYELKRDPEASPDAKNLKSRDILPAKAEMTVDADAVPTQKEVFETFSGRLLQIPEVSSMKPESVQHSLKTTEDYLEISNAPLVSELPLSHVFPVLPSDLKVSMGYSPDVEAVKVKELNWHNVDKYASSRLGPITEILDRMDKNDAIMLSNNSIDTSVMALKDISKLEVINLPVSSWDRTIHLATHDDGHRTIIIGGFPGKVMMKHYQLLLKTHMKDTEEAPQIFIAESDKQYQKNYSRLNDFFTANEKDLGKIDTVVVGYDRAFRDRWGKFTEKEVKPGGSPWSAEIYELPNKKRVAVLASSASFHGEILGENLKNLTENHPEIKEVFLGGSGGSLHVRDPYKLVFPKRIIGESGQELQNILSGSTEDLSHKSVISPMVETPGFLSETAKQGTTTVDMEMGHVAEALAGSGVKVGIGILVTDFPIKRKISDESNLTFQDSAVKYKEMSGYADSIFNYLESGKPVYEHEIENKLGISLDAISKKNLEWELNDMGTLTPDEKVLFDRLCGITPNYSFRMTAKRLTRVLEDGAILSTAQVARMKNIPVSPVTPEIEDKMYGALDYTFGAVSFGHGDDMYGEVNVEIKPEVWQSRSWASYRSGWRSLIGAQKEIEDGTFDYEKADPELFKKGMERFSQWLVVPEDYSKSMAAWAIRQLRKAPELMKEMMKASDEDLAWLINKNGLMYLEGKIKGSLNLEDIERVAVPKNCPEELMNKLSELGIPVKVLDK